MTHERDQAHASASPESATARDEYEPGRASRTALMRKPDFAIASGLVQRKARDANGVAEGADSAVAAASSSSGSPLPDTLQRKFESSLGADLSGVRVHTGGSSAAANDAVGAKAYTMGNDIHFGAGHYDPSSSSGEHLLAHEVAHTVQQSGGAQRMQFKLSVSSPHDALEHEADRAADAMVAGKPAQASASSGGAFRKEDESYDPSGQDVVGIGDDSAPREINWREGATPVYTDLGTTPPEIISPKLNYDPSRAMAHPDAVKALDGVSAACYSGYNEMAKVLAAFRAAVALAEKATTGASVGSKDPMQGLDKTHQEGAGKNLGEAFKDNEVNIIDPAEAALDAASADERKEIIDLKKAAALSAEDVQGAEGDVLSAIDDVADAKEEVQKAVNAIHKADNNAKAAAIGKETHDVEVDKTKVEAKIKAFTNLVNVAKGLKGMAGKDKEAGAMEAIEATVEIVSASNAMKYDRKLEALQVAADDLVIDTATLEKDDAVHNYNIAARAVGKKVRECAKMNTAYKKAVNERIAKYHQLGLKIEAAMLKNGVPPADAKKAQTAIQAVPLIEETIAKLKAISSSASPPEYSKLSGQGASMCTNLGMVLAMVGLLKGYQLAANSATIDWNKRLSSVNGLIGAAKVY